MTITIGEVIKKKRLELGLTQSELAEGICTQATISNLESSSSVPTILTFLKITERLGIAFNEVYEYSLEHRNEYSVIFKEIQELCSIQEHKKANELLNEKIDLNQLESPRDIKKYYYYAGVTSVIGLKNISDGIYYFNQALGTDPGKEDDFFDILAMNGIGIAYNMADDYEKALTYYEKSMVELERFLSTVVTIKDTLEIIKIYYNTAEFYSKIKKYNKALNLCSLGIQLLQNENLSFCLDLLLYEKAFNLLQLGRRAEAEKFYLYALVTADLNNNETAMTVIKSDMKEYNIQEYKYG